MSWRDVLGNFVELGKEEGAATPPTTQTSTSVIPGIPGVVVQAPAPPVIKTQVAGPDPGLAVNSKPFEDKLRQVLGRNTVYTQLLGAVDALREAGVEEERLLNAALKVLGKQGVSNADVVGAVKLAASSLLTESGNFSTLLDGQRTAEIKARETKIQDLTTQIQGLKDQRDKTAEELVQQKNKLNAAEVGFQAALNKLQEELNDMMGKLAPKGGVTNA